MRLSQRVAVRQCAGLIGCVISAVSLWTATPEAQRKPRINPLIAKQEVRFKVPASPDGKEVTLALVAADAGDGNEHDFVVWQQPRLVATPHG